MPYVRVTRDQRGYENVFLMHSPHPGEPPHILYWYRTAPGIRVGRPAFDEDAIRQIEDQYPDVDFDWAHLIEDASTLPPDVERPPERGDRRRRRPSRPASEDIESPGPERAAVAAEEAGAVAPAPPATGTTPEPAPAEGQPSSNPLLEPLVGRENAQRLRARYAELSARIDERAPDPATRAAWHARAAALDPDRWTTPQAVLDGVQNAEPLYEALRREIGG